MRFGFTPDGPDRCACTWTENRGAGYKGYAQGISVGGLIGLTVATQGGVPPTITTNGGTLQMVATVFPAAANQNVSWSIVPGTGMASISTAGLVTGISNGTVYAKAAAVQDPSVQDSLMITLSNQTAQAPSVITLEATGITSSEATLNGTVNANTLSTDVTFDWGLTSAYVNTVNATPPTVTGNTVTPVLAVLTGLTSNTTYHFRVKGVNAAGTSVGADLTFVTSQGVGSDEKGPMKIDIYPVPNDGRFNVSVRYGSGDDLSMEVYNILGSTILHKENFQVSGNNVTVVDLGDVPSGLYTIILRSSKEARIFKFPVRG